jgi:nucleotide-binding universal stress UspA family protein
LKEIKNIMVPIDLTVTDLSNSCVDYALGLAKKLDATIHLLHAIHEPQEASGFSTPHVSMDRVHEEAKGRLERKVRVYAASQIGDSADFVTEVRIGLPAEVITQYANDKNIDLIVIGEKRKGKVAQALSQKTVSKILGSSDRPVLRLILPG